MNNANTTMTYILLLQYFSKRFISKSSYLGILIIAHLFWNLRV